MQKVLAIVGPTAVGKTKLSLLLAHRYHGEIISGDSMQVYRHLNVGTAKIMPDQRQGIPHYLLGIRSIYQRYTAADFVREARRLISSIASRGHLPIVVGGTGFYLQALFKSLPLGNSADRNLELRRRLARFADFHGQRALWRWLANVDPVTAKRIPYQNERRVIRALEVNSVTGHSFTHQPAFCQLRYNTLLVGLITDRQLLYRRINYRVDLMMKRGLVTEARWLFDCGGSALPAGMGIGYHEFYGYFRHEISLARAVALVKRDSRHYAKRQLTWFHNQMHASWYDLIREPEQLKLLNSKIKVWLTDG